MSMVGRWAVVAIFVCLCGAISAPSAFAAYRISDDAMAAMKLLDKKDYRGAVEAADRALKASPTDPIARATRGNAYVELGDYEHAMIDHDAVLAQVGDDPGALVNACWVRALANTDLDRARTYCDKAVVKRGSLREYDTRGFLDLRQGNFEAAISDYGNALQARPKTASPLYGLGVAKIRLGKVAEGQDDIARATRLQADIAQVYARRGMNP